MTTSFCRDRRYRGPDIARTALRVPVIWSVGGGFGILVAAARSEKVVQPGWPDRLSTQLVDTLAQAAIGGDHNDSGSGNRELRHEGVVAAMGGVHDTHAVQVGFRATCTGLTFENDHRRQRERSAPSRLSQSFNELAGRAGPVAPPPRRSRANDVGRIDHEHPSKSRSIRSPEGLVAAATSATTWIEEMSRGPGSPGAALRSGEPHHGD
jgi:hypothetical protein